LAIAGGIVLLLVSVLIWLNSGTGERPVKPRGSEPAGRIPGSTGEESTQALPEPQPGQPAVAKGDTLPPVFQPR
jgi:hypothetical protein